MSETIRDGCELAGFELGGAKANLERVLREPGVPSEAEMAAVDAALARIDQRRNNKGKRTETQ